MRDKVGKKLHNPANLLQQASLSVAKHIDYYLPDLTPAHLQQFTHLLTAFDDAYLPPHLADQLIRCLQSTKRLRVDYYCALLRCSEETSTADLSALKLPQPDTKPLGCSPIDFVLLHGVGRCRNLTTLNLARCGKKATNAALQEALSGLPRLRHVDLSGWDKLSDRTLEVLVRTTHKKNKREGKNESENEEESKGAGLHSLSLSLCCRLSSQKLGELAGGLCGLVRLNLNGCSWLEDDALLQLFHHCTALKSLDLAGCWEVTDRAFADTVSFANHNEKAFIIERGTAAAFNRQTGLTYLDVSVTTISDKSVHAIATVCTQLQTLIMEGCLSVTDNAFLLPSASTSSSHSPFCSLQELKLGGCTSIRGDNALRNIVRNCPHLQKLALPPSSSYQSLWRILGCYSLEPEEDDDDDDEEDEGIHRGLSDLRWLSLRNCNQIISPFPSSEGDEEEQAAMESDDEDNDKEGLQRSPTSPLSRLRHLDFTASSIGDDILQDLARAFSLSSSSTNADGINEKGRIEQEGLTELCLSGCTAVGNVGVEAIALSCRCTLTHLDVSRCPRVTVQALKRVLPEMKALRTVSLLSCTRITVSHFNALRATYPHISFVWR
ncbi:hypothetical protein QOT17_004028 [Balamuthia mandrillaris]